MLPQLFKAKNHGTWDEAMSSTDGGPYVPARSLPLYRNPIQNLLTRIALAYGVLTGKYDALHWTDK